MKKTLKKLIATAVLFSSHAWAQSGGSIDPPVGTPATTMKTLDEVEARIAISSLPYTITTSGSYYVTKKLISAGDGITISASDVTLDLNGFTLEGTSSDVTHEGVKLEGSVGAVIENVKVSNGVIRGFGNSVELHYADSSVISHLFCSGAGAVSVVVSDSNFNTIESNKARVSAGSALVLTNSTQNKLKYNHFSDTTNTHIGIQEVSGSLNLVVHNFCIGFDTNFDLTNNSIYGPEIDKDGELGNKGDEVHPWANFSF